MTVYLTFCWLSLFLLMQREGVSSLTCGNGNITKSLRIKENGLINISCHVNTSETSGVSDTFFAVYEVCEWNSMKPRCTFDWKRKFNNMTVKPLGKPEETVCSVERRDLSNSVFELKISQWVSRSLRQVRVSVTDNDETFKTIHLIHIDVLYPPRIINLTVDGQEVTGNHLMNKSQMIAISCFFDKGNPPGSFRLLDASSRQLAIAPDDRHLTYVLEVQCDDDWPTVCCAGGDGLEENKSVSFLVRCPPQFIDTFPTVSGHGSHQHWVFNIKAHTTALERCHVTSSSATDNSSSEVNCTLTGRPPYLVLTLHLEKEDRSKKASIWTVIVQNEAGSSRATVTLDTTSRPEDFQHENDNDDFAFRLGLGITAVVGITIVAAFVKPQ